MKKSVLAGILSVFGFGPAIAADLPVKAPIAPPRPVLSWTGCYIGANAGGGWGIKDYNDPLAAPPENILGVHRVSGGLGGGQVGCDYQFGRWVVGLQGAGESSSLKGTHLTAFGDFLNTKVSWLTTATARFGYTFTPNLLVYGIGGVAWVRDHETKVDGVTFLLEGTADITRNGWLVGAGGEYLITPHVSVFAEYNYLDFGRRQTMYVTPDIPPAFFPLDIKQQVQTLRVGVNVRFNPFGAGALVAKY
jgi:outer membrane immunogenic protein